MDHSAVPIDGLARLGPARLTAKGRATRERIVRAAAELMHEHGAAGTSTPDLRNAAGVSSSQIYHYFADKDGLTRAVIAYQADAILAIHSDLLSRIDSLDGLRVWRDAIVELVGRAGGAGGCPLGSLSSELADHDDAARAALAEGFARWSDTIQGGLRRLVDHGELAPDADLPQLSRALLAAIQGGLVLAQVQRTTDALEAALDTVIDRIAGLSPPSVTAG